MSKFQYNKIYEFNLSGKIQFGNIQNDVLHKLFTDGRVTGLLSEYFIESEFANINRVRNANSALDVIDDKGKKCEVKCFTKNGVSFLPSNQKGEGRAFNREKYNERIKNIDYFIIVNITIIPMLTVLSINSSVILSSGKKNLKHWTDVVKMAKKGWLK